MERDRVRHARRAVTSAAVLMIVAGCSDEIRAPTEPLGLERERETAV